ncbi:DUF2249 domain-containing protein [Treponema sp. OMZ 840]|uniref:DUF2249 domain-containing protein n=1 Tax=Treponema sp. OMZ 840 TaxID=244313 RepID=UPI003D94536A
MSYENWKDKTADFEKIDVRQLQGNFFPGLKKKAESLKAGEGLVIIQRFEPHPLYEVFEKMGFEYHTEEIAENEFHAFFYRTEVIAGDDDTGPFRPIALLNYPLIDEDLGKIAVDFWNVTWKSKKRSLPYEMRLLLSLTNAAGAGRMRQASRELIKAYACGVDTAVFDDIFELLAWNQGIGYFSSEIGPSALFQAYKMIKAGEKRGKSRKEILDSLTEKFGEKNPEVGVQ